MKRFFCASREEWLDLIGVPEKYKHVILNIYENQGVVSINEVQNSLNENIKTEKEKRIILSKKQFKENLKSFLQSG